MGMSGLNKLKAASKLYKARHHSRSLKGTNAYKARKEAANMLRKLRKTPTGRQTASTIRYLAKTPRG